MVAVAPVHVTTKRVGNLSVAGVVRCVYDEFAQWLELTLDTVEAAGGARDGNQFDVVQLGPLTNLGCPVQHQVVIDQVDAQVFGVASSDVLVEGQHFARGRGQTIATEQHVGVEVVCAEEVADPTPAHIRGSIPPEPLALGIAMARVRAVLKVN